ncbi:hypothetical protein [Haploplasma axanthum]|uniref:Uncharacterized protein n=1 Tax=Haploplasma axanthum TaxID=29552 RepID=A0A449BB79_HAPAX|nr:hypothetical protein [Haploplasma axanthum]VEU79597.1 Uncharacterised protein [Haploplasma axanthum]
MKYKMKVLIGLVLIVFIVLIVLFYKPKKTFSFKSEGLEKIILINENSEKELSNDDFETFLNELNNQKYKSKSTNVKTKGSFFIELRYENEIIRIGRYTTEYESGSKPTLFNKSFDEFVEKWFKM